jgi:hypothetical protein
MMIVWLGRMFWSIYWPLKSKTCNKLVEDVFWSRILLALSPIINYQFWTYFALIFPVRALIVAKFF